MLAPGMELTSLSGDPDLQPAERQSGGGDPRRPTPTPAVRGRHPETSDPRSLTPREDPRNVRPPPPDHRNGHPTFRVPDPRPPERASEGSDPRSGGLEEGVGHLGSPLQGLAAPARADEEHQPRPAA